MAHNIFRLFILLLLPLLVSCALGNEWEQAKSTDEAYRKCLERHKNDPDICADHREGAQQAQQRYEEHGREMWGYPGETP